MGNSASLIKTRCAAAILGRAGLVAPVNMAQMPIPETVLKCKGKTAVLLGGELSFCQPAPLPLLRRERPLTFGLPPVFTHPQCVCGVVLC